jgi:hypothetical protein
MFPTTLFIYFLICGIPGLILWYRMLRIMESKGRMVNYLWVSPTQFMEFNNLIAAEKDPNVKTKYRTILWIQIALIPIYLIGMIILLTSR